MASSARKSVAGPHASPLKEDEAIYVDSRHSLIALSPAMRDVMAQVSKLASVDAAILLSGESGTGKELIARTIHMLSNRSSHNFIKANCSALPPELLESELFGHEAGAFPEALHARPGKFALAHEGTLLLDDIAALPPASQPRILHALLEGEFAPLGAATTAHCNVRLIASTGTELRQAVDEGTFRSDLFFHLNGFTISLPPLRERQQDIPYLLEQFMDRWASEYGRPRLPITGRILEASSNYTWPGNLRELENFVRRYLVLGDEDQALHQLESHAGHSISPADTDSNMPAHSGNSELCDLKNVVRGLKQDAERAAIIQALEQTRGNKQEAAILLRISLRALHYKVRAYGIDSASVRAKRS